jgi:pseudaminic acid cytidylyltransferase
MKTHEILVIMPARSGSKRIPKKNIKSISGQPMIYWPLMELAKEFSSQQMLISTDAEEIISVVEKKGLKVPFIRPKSLADDFTGTMAVATHALNWYEEHISPVKYVLIVYPTAVLLDIEDVKQAFSSLVADPNCSSVMSAASFDFPIQRAVFVNSDGYAEMFEPENYSTRSQDLVAAMHDAGQFYMCRAEPVRQGKILTNSNVKLHMLHRNKVIDIDTKEDFEVAERKMKFLGLSEYNPDWYFDR